MSYALLECNPLPYVCLCNQYRDDHKTLPHLFQASTKNTISQGSGMSFITRKLSALIYFAVKFEELLQGPLIFLAKITICFMCCMLNCSFLSTNSVAKF